MCAPNMQSNAVPYLLPQSTQHVMCTTCGVTMMEARVGRDAQPIVNACRGHGLRCTASLQQTTTSLPLSSTRCGEHCSGMEHVCWCTARLALASLPWPTCWLSAFTRCAATARCLPVQPLLLDDVSELLHVAMHIAGRATEPRTFTHVRRDSWLAALSPPTAVYVVCVSCRCAHSDGPAAHSLHGEWAQHAIPCLPSGVHYVVHARASNAADA
jgi:hypothetical protein